VELTDNFFSFEGKHVVVAGGTSGIGLATARNIKELGGAVTIIGRNSVLLSELQVDGFRVINHDLFELDSFKDLVQSLDEFDGLLWAAGMAETPRPFGMLSISLMEELMTKNCYAPFEFIVKAQKARKIKNGGSICYVSSVIEKCGTLGSGGYSASKTAFSALTRSMGQELAKKGIRINSVAYGYVKTKFLDSLGVSEDSLNLAPLGIPDALEASGVASFLLSDASKYITRQTVIADSGVTLHQALV
jgi:NAD(P)-dependent dehydrogenase (short-subunit alcohol dehydrogenase family)